MRCLLASCLLLASLFVITHLSAGPQKKDEIAKLSLKVGDPAPDFTLLSDDWKTVKLSDFHGKKNVLLAVYVLAFTGG
jgi:cytochrome oxidase Cu insertion factor (SCO1/SenC/PrrC family)